MLYFFAMNSLLQELYGMQAAILEEPDRTTRQASSVGGHVILTEHTLSLERTQLKHFSA